MSNKPKQYEGTEFSRQMVVINSDFYNETQEIAKKDTKRPLKAGEVFRIYRDFAIKYAPPGALDAALEQARDIATLKSAGELRKQLNALSEDKRAEVMRLLTQEA